MKMKKLTAKERQFCVEYVACNCGSEAAIKAGYAEKSARITASKLLTKTNIQQEIAKLKEKQEKRTIGEGDKVILELKKIGFSDIRQIFNEDGTIKDVHLFPEEAAKAVSAIEVDEVFCGVGADRKKIGYTKKIKLWNKVDALDRLCRHFNLYKDGDSLKDLLQGITVNVTKNYGKNE